MAILLTYIGVNSWLLTRGIRTPFSANVFPLPSAEMCFGFFPNLAVRHVAAPYVDCKFAMNINYTTNSKTNNNSVYYDNRPTRVSQPCLLIVEKSKM